MIATAIITAPRPRPTLEYSLMSYREAGFENPVHIFADGAPAPFRGPYADRWGSEIIINPLPLGNLRNWISACRTLYQTTSDPFIMICEDDVTWAENAANVLASELSNWSHSSTGMISLYLPRRMSKLLESVHSRGSKLKSGYYGIKFGRKLWGAQCLVLPRTEVPGLLECGYMQSVLKDPNKKINVDAHVAESMFLRDREIFYRAPCLVDHVMGDLNSSLYGAKDRPDLRTSYFEEVARATA